MIDHAYLQTDEGDWVLVLEDSFGTHWYKVDPEMIEIALQPWRDHVLEGEQVRREFEASGRQSWDQYRVAQSRLDPELGEQLAEAADWFRKAAREGYVITNRDPGDEDGA